MRHPLHRLAILAGLGWVLGLLAIAAAPALGSAPVATLAPDPASLTFLPQLDYSLLTVTLSGPDGVFAETFEAGAPPTVDLAALPDGAYTWELSLAPVLDEETRGRMAAAATESERGAVVRQLRAEGKLPAEPLVASGYFTLISGRRVADTGEEEARAALPAPAARGRLNVTGRSQGPRNVTALDQVFNDDVIITGSLCVGFDCVNGEDFGYDTIRLKENNLRIKFQDTSTLASYPTRDWQLTANDSANGGAEKFSIDDIDGSRTPFTIEAGAPSHSLYVDDAGRAGFGTSTPVVEIHAKDGDTPTVRLEQDGTSGFAPQTWDVAGNETNFFIRDVTSGSRLSFRIQPGAPSNSLFIDSTGEVGIGTSAPAADLHVVGDATEAGIRFATTGGSAQEWDFQVNSSGTFAIRDETHGVTPFKILNTNTNANVLVLGSNRVGIGTINPAGTLDVDGSIYQRGSVLHADYVFEPDYELESIEEHATFMWERKHLPAVAGKQVDEQGREMIELGARSRGLLEELEKAHIYIERLNEALKQRDAAIAELAERLAKLEAAS